MKKNKNKSFDIEEALATMQRQLDFIVRNQSKILRKLEITKENSQGANKCSNMVVDYIEYKEGANPIYNGKYLKLNAIATNFGRVDDD